jgi:hypothetical protein
MRHHRVGLAPRMCHAQPPGVRQLPSSAACRNGLAISSIPAVGATSVTAVPRQTCGRHGGGARGPVSRGRCCLAAGI